MASTVSSLKDCERWRGEIVRDISRKVSKIQDVGLTDYEIRDLNDEINKLMREKGHWERQIVTLGGANYRRARTAMVDDEGREVPGTRGYKYFGRAKDLPGVKELFQRGAVQETEESARHTAFQKFRNQGADYYGDVDEMDQELVKEEEAMERQDWDSACARLVDALELQEDTTVPPFPKANAPAAAASSTNAQKRKATDEDVEMAGTSTEGEGDKRTKLEGQSVEEGSESNGHMDASTAAALASFFGVLDQASMEHPKQPNKEELEAILLDVRKRSLLAEYGV